jgi:hypothetical protein
MFETQNERNKRVKGQEYQINEMRGKNLRKFYRGRADYDEKKKRKRKPINWCRPVNHRLQPGPVVALASFPGSGNTWLRYLLQQATGTARLLTVLFVLFIGLLIGSVCIFILCLFIC